MASSTKKRRLPSDNMASILSIGAAEISNRTLEKAIHELPDDSRIDDVEAGPAFPLTAINKQSQSFGTHSVLTNIGEFQKDIGDSVQLDIDDSTGEFVTQSNFPPETEQPTKRRSRGITKSKTKTIDALLGQAALLAARSQYDEAMELLREVVRQDPRRPHAYRQIAEIYEMKDDLIRCFEFNLLACHVDRNSVAYEWDQVGDLAVKIGKLSAAAACYQRASKAANDSWIYYAKRMTVLEDMGNKDLIWRTKLSAMEFVDSEKAELPFPWFKDMMIETIEYFKKSDDERYLKALTFYVFRCFKAKDDYEDAFMELTANLCDKQLYSQLVNLILCIKKDNILCYNEDGELAYATRSTQAMMTIFPPLNESNADHVVVKKNVNTVMLARLILAMVKLEISNCIKSLFDELANRPFDLDAEKLYLNIGLSIENSGDYFQGLYYAEVLTRSTHLSDYANGWYLLGFYRERCCGPEEALEAYYECLKHDVSHVDARISISTILEAMDKPDEAIDILKDYNLDGCNRLPDERLLIRQAQMFVNQEKSVEHLRCLRMILIPHFYLVSLKMEQILKQRKNLTNRVVNVNLRRAIMLSLSRTPLEKLVNRLGAIAERENRDLYSLSTDELHRLSMELITGLSKTKQYHELLSVVGYTFLHPRMPPIHMETFQNLLFYAAIKAENFVLAFEYLRYTHSVLINTTEFNEEERKKRISRLFSAMNYVFTHHQTIAMQRYIHRCTLKNSTASIIRVIAGNNSLTSGSYKNALFEYNYTLKDSPHDPGLHLLISLCFCHLSCRRDITNRLAVARRGIGYMGKYMNFRLENGPPQEVYYNIGRMFHQFGMITHAIYWYNLVLDEPAPQVVVEDVRTGDGTLVSCPSYDLKPIAAFNIALLLKDSNPTYARTLKKKFCVLG